MTELDEAAARALLDEYQSWMTAKTTMPGNEAAYQVAKAEAAQRLLDFADQLSRSLASSLTEIASMRQDAELLNAISKPGATTRVYGVRVYRNALENRADPPMEVLAEALIPHANGTCVSSRRTLREAIDDARRTPDPTREQEGL